MLFDDATTLLRWKTQVRFSKTTQEKGEYEKEFVIIVTEKRKKDLEGNGKQENPENVFLLSIEVSFRDIVLSATNYFTNDVWF